MKPNLSRAVAAICLLLPLCSRVWAAAPLTLDECVSRALATIPKLAQASAGLDLSDAQRREIAASLVPGVRADVQYLQQPGYREVITNRGLSTAQLIADYTVYDGGRRLARLHAATYATQASRFGLAAARIQVVYDTTVAFFGLIRAARIEKELQASTQRLQRYMSILETLRASGRATANDVLRIDLMLRDARLKLNAAEHDRSRAVLALGALIGEFGGEDLAVAEPPASTSQRESKGIDASPALRALEHNRASAVEELRAAKAERYPTLNAELTAGFLGTDPPSTISKYAGASYGGVLSIPIFQGGAIGARIDQAEARVRQAQAQLAQARIDIAERLAAARSRLDEAARSASMVEEAVPIAEASFVLSWSRFLGGGNATMLEVVDSYDHLVAKRLALADEQFAAHQATAEITMLTAAGVP